MLGTASIKVNFSFSSYIHPLFEFLKRGLPAKKSVYCDEEHLLQRETCFERVAGYKIIEFLEVAAVNSRDDFISFSGTIINMKSNLAVLIVK